MGHDKGLWIKNEKDAFLALDGSGKILDASAPVEQVTGYKPEELIDRSLGEWIPDPGARQQVLAAVAESLAREAVAVEEFRFRKKNGKDFAAEMILMPFRAAGHEPGCRCLLRDVTALREADKRMQEAHAMREQFTATISHELRTPLAVIKETLVILSANEAGPVSAGQKRFLDIAQANVERLEKMVVETLELNELEQGRKVFHVCENSVGELFNEIKHLKDSEAGKKGLKIIVQINSGVPRINFDREQIRECFKVLVDFSIRKSEKGDIVLGACLENNMVRMSVRAPSDEKPCEDLSRLFLRFEALDGEEKAKLGRTGVEFARVREIVEKHHGKVWAYFFPGQGTFFQIILPVWEKRARVE